MKMPTLPAFGLVLLSSSLAGADTVMLDPAQDTTICDNGGAGDANALGQFMFTGVTNNGAGRRALLSFDLASIPAGATIDSVSFTMTQSKSKTTVVRDVSLHRVTTTWAEGGSMAAGPEGRCASATAGDATWIHSEFDTVPWNTPGGDFVPTASATLAVAGVGIGGSPVANTWVSTPELVADVQAWLDDPASNHGWILIGDESGMGTAMRYNSRQNASPATRPLLTIGFTPGGGGPNVYESLDPANIVAPPNQVGTGTSPYDHTPRPESPAYYQVDDGTGNPAVIYVIKNVPDPLQIRISW